MDPDARVIHQFAHGYLRGHRLLTSSVDVTPAMLSTINRASDAAPEYRPSDGSYLTGYGLQDGSWAIARTWPALEADRPNTVWTHTLLVPSDLVGRVSIASLVKHLRHPG